VRSAAAAARALTRRWRSLTPPSRPPRHPRPRALQLACAIFFCAIWALWAYAEWLHHAKRKAAHRRARDRRGAARARPRLTGA
jgi:hypothetical protein